MMVARHSKPENVNLAHVAEIINGDVFDYAKWALRNTHDPFIRQKLKRYAADKADEIRSLSEIVENLRTEMGFLSDEAIAACVKRNDFTFAQCKRAIVTIYIMLPFEVLEVLGKFNSLLLGSAFGELFREDGHV